MPDPVMVGALPLKRRPPLIQVTERQSVTYPLDFTNDAIYIVNLGIQQGQQVFGFPQTVYIDNSANPNNVELTIQGTGFQTTLPAFALGFFPVDALINDNFIFESTAGATDFVKITIYNYEIAPAVWYSTDPLSPGFDVQAILPAATSVTSRNYTLLAATAHNVFPAVATPSVKVAKNMTDEVIYWQINADATGVAANNYQMNPGEGFNGPDLQLMFRTAQRISMYSTNGGLVQGLEWTV